MKNKKTLFGGIALGMMLTVGTLATTANAGLWNILTTGDWETISTLKQKLDVKGEDMRIYTWVAPLNSGYGCSMAFANSGNGMVCFPIDPDNELVAPSK